MPLSDLRVRSVKPKVKPFKLADGGGMYLLVKPDGSRYWRMDYRFAQKRKTLALGVYPEVSLADARAKRDAARRLLSENVDPSTDKQVRRAGVAADTDKAFESVARAYMSDQRHRLDLRYWNLLMARLEADIFPAIGRRPIDEIDAPELLAALKQVEARGVVETTIRLRQLCGQIFRYAVAKGLAKYDPTFALRGALKTPGRAQGHKAMPLRELPDFIRKLNDSDLEPRTRLALRLMVLTFVRTTELRAARWSEFENLDGRDPLWRIPADRMKRRLEHLVPLSRQAVAVLKELQGLPGYRAEGYLFPSPSREGFMSNNTMLYALYRLGYHGRATVHGFRATASTALNELGFRSDVIERQLAHEEKNAVRAAYNRAEYLIERREMMQRWADHLDKLAGA